MQINKKELSLLKEEIIKSGDPHSEIFKRFLDDVEKINEYIERIPFGHRAS
jgi:hypothetical protein